MSVASIGGQGSPLNHILQSMLSRLQTAAQPLSPDPATGAAASVSAASGKKDCDQGGQGTAQLSSDVLRVLMTMQEQSGSQDGSGTSSTLTPASLTAADPAQQLFSAMDTDGDGTVSQAEMESYIEKQGGTQQQADALYSSLNQSGASGLSESQFASAAQQGGGAHHHHHHHGGGLADRAAQDLIQAADGNGDNALSQNELENFFTQIGGTKNEADQDFAALTADGSTTVTGSALADALKSLDASKVNLSDQTSPILTVLDAIAQQEPKSTAGSVSA